MYRPFCMTRWPSIRENLSIMSAYFCQTPVPSPDFSLGLGVDFVLPLSQQEEQEPCGSRTVENSLL